MNTDSKTVLKALTATALVSAFVYWYRRKPQRSTSLSVKQLSVYPIKSCAGIDLQSSEIGPQGLKFDRKWMLVDADSKAFITLRECQALAFVRTEICADELHVHIPNHNVFKLPYFSESDLTAPVVKVRVWKSECEAIDQGDDIAAALSAFCQRSVRLVKMSPLFKRNLNPKYALHSDNYTDFSDDMPLLITTTASLHALQRKSKCDIDMRQFRPNLVLESEYSFEEIDWRALRVGSLELAIAKRCTRCQIPTMNIESGKFDSGGEPIKSLRALRQTDQNDNVLFGVYAIPMLNENTAIPSISIGDSATVLAFRE